MSELKNCSLKSIEDFLVGKLSDDDSKQMETHLENCKSCRSSLNKVSTSNQIVTSVNSALQDDQWDKHFGHDQTIGRESLDQKVIDPNRSTIDFEEIPSERQRKSNLLESLQYFMSPSDIPNSLGRIGLFEIIGLVGRGGMGVVLKARDPSLDRIVAIKMLTPHLIADEEAKTRFCREAKAAATVNHPNIIAIHGVSVHRGIPYLVMPYEIGPSLARRVKEEGPLTIKEAINVATQIVSALAEAHESGLIHRDIKPSNILLAPGTERALLTDFGLAILSDQKSLTRTGFLAGTPAYMSPEQARGEAVTVKSDLFSLGSVIFFMLTGSDPTTKETSYGIVREVSANSMLQVADFLESAPDWVNQLVKRLHSSDPADRFESTKHLLEVIKGCQSHLNDSAINPLPKILIRETKGRKRPSLVMILCFLIATVFCIPFVFNKPNSKTVPTDEPSKNQTIPAATKKQSRGQLATENEIRKLLDDHHSSKWNDGLSPWIKNASSKINRMKIEDENWN